MSVARAAEAARAVTRPRSPYVGLVPYDEADAEFFFGRSREVAIVRANLRSARLTILYGPSGVGKSSLLMAGLVHDLREEARALGGEAPFAVCAVRSWFDDPVRAVREAGRAALQEAVGDEPLPAARRTLVDSLRAWTRRAGTLLLVLDQFEEYFQYHPADSDGERVTGFAAELTEIVNDTDLAVHVLLSIREDAWAKLDRFEGHIPLLFANYLRVDHLDLEAAREAIEGPIAAWNRTLPAGAERYEIEPRLVDAVLSAAGGRPTFSADGEVPTTPAPGDRVEAPFLQLVLDRLWRTTVAEEGRVLTLARLESLGGAGRIVENHVLEALGRLAEPEQDTASDCFRFLVSGGKTKIAQPVADLAEWTRRPETQVTAVLDKLCSGDSGRILRAVSPTPDEPGRVGYELFHDVLVEPILAWRGRHEHERARRVARRRLVRVGAGALAVVLVLAGFATWALVERGHAERLFHEQRAERLALAHRVDELKEEKRNAAILDRERRARVQRLRAANRGLRAEARRLQATRSTLNRRISLLRAHNRKLGGAIGRFRRMNRRLTRQIGRLDAQYRRLGAQLAGARAAQEELVEDAAVLRAERRALEAQLRALLDRNAELEKKAAEFRVAKPVTSFAPGLAAGVPAIGGARSRLPGQKTAGISVERRPLPGSTELRRQLERLERQLGQLLEQRTRLADEAAWLRKANALLAREGKVLRKEIVRLRATRAALQAQTRTLQQRLRAVAAEHRRLAAAVAARQTRNGERRRAVEAARRQTAVRRARNAELVDAIAETRADIRGVRRDNRALVAFVAPRVERLLRGARDPSVDPGLGGLLAVKAYRLTPFDPDASAHPAVYNALWFALSRLDANAARGLIAPVAKPHGKVGTTRSARFVEKICGLVRRGLTPQEWSRFLPDARFTAKASRPCR